VPSGGAIVFDGVPLRGLPPHAIARRGVSRSFQRTNLFARLGVLENLRLAAAASERGSYDLFRSVERLSRPLARAREVAEAVGLSSRLGEPAGSLSYGEQRQLELGVALATSPKLLLLDEPTAGMSPEETAHMTRLLVDLPRDVTLLIIEHDMDVVFSLADRITVLHHGEVLTEGTPEAVRGDERVYEVYLGTADEP
jgi:branched-chain amino acid transport system ATP-binding protein